MLTGHESRIEKKTLKNSEKENMRKNAEKKIQVAEKG